MKEQIQKLRDLVVSNPDGASDYLELLGRKVENYTELVANGEDVLYNSEKLDFTNAIIGILGECLKEAGRAW